jgi:hypothetical protein
MTAPARTSASQELGIFAQEHGPRRTSFGYATYVKFRTHDYAQLSWSDVCAAFQERYPGQWAVQFFPPAEDTVDDANVYHLYVLEDAPTGVNISRHSQKD